jgi:hypothetical protein
VSIGKSKEETEKVMTRHFRPNPTPSIQELSSFGPSLYRSAFPATTLELALLGLPAPSSDGHSLQPLDSQVPSSPENPTQNSGAYIVCGSKGYGE